VTALGGTSMGRDFRRRDTRLGEPRLPKVPKVPSVEDGLRARRSGEQKDQECRK